MHDPDSKHGEITHLLRGAEEGDQSARGRLFDLIYKDLRRMAAHHLRRNVRDKSLQPTALVHEAYLRLFTGKTVSIRDRNHFVALAAQVMRHVLVDRARAQTAQRRDVRQTVKLDEVMVYTDDSPDEILALHAALNKLAAFAPRQSSVVEMRFFGGMNEEEIAAILQVSTRSVKRDWVIAKVWLHAELKPLSTQRN
jgi:RNA polymerase sigma factor (TIGR02999 family)